MCFAYLATLLISGNYFDFRVELGISFLLKSVPWILITYAIRDFRLINKYLYISSYIIMLSVLLNVYLFKTTIYTGLSYTQEYTYMVLPVAIIAISSIFNRIRVHNTILFLVSAVFLFSMGARGPLFSLFLYIILKLILYCKTNIKKMMRVIPLITASIILVIIFFKDILNSALILFQKLNLGTRSILRILEGTFFDDINRVLLVKHSRNLIIKYPLFGVGLGTDRIYLAQKMNLDFASGNTGWYPHNIFLEIILHFGIIIGAILIIYMIKVFFTVIFKNRDKDAVNVICIFMGIGFFPLLISGSYLTSPLFYALMGFCLFQYKVLKENKLRRKLNVVEF